MSPWFRRQRKHLINDNWSTFGIHGYLIQISQQSSKSIPFENINIELFVSKSQLNLSVNHSYLW